MSRSLIPSFRHKRPPSLYLRDMRSRVCYALNAVEAIGNAPVFYCRKVTIDKRPQTLPTYTCRRQLTKWQRARARKNQPIYPTWDTFGGSWPEKAARIGFRQAFGRTQAEDEANFRLAKQRIFSFPFKKAYTFWVHYYKCRLVTNANNTTIAVSEHLVQMFTIASILKTAPRQIGQAVESDANKLHLSCEAMMRNMTELRSTQLLRAHLRDFPLYAYARARSHRIAKLRRLQKKKEHLQLYTKHQRFGQRLREIKQETLSTFFDTHTQSFNKHPESWGIEPLHIATNMAMLETKNLLRHMQASGLRHTVGVNKWPAVESIISQVLDLQAHIRDLSTELEALRYWKLQCFPGSMSDAECRLGKWFWRLVRAEHGAGGAGDAAALIRVERIREEWRPRYIYKYFGEKVVGDGG